MIAECRVDLYAVVMELRRLRMLYDEAIRVLEEYQAGRMGRLETAPMVPTGLPESPA